MASAVSLLKGGNERFNAEAAAWDKNPFVHAASLEASKALLQKVPKLNRSSEQGRGIDILEIGCGTGLLSSLIAPHAHHIVAVDAAHGMIDVLKGKVQQFDTLKNINPVCVLLEDPEDPALPAAMEDDPNGPRMKFDLITSHLVLHHIADLKSVLQTMLGCLKTGGSVALTDFEDFGPKARRFHSKGRLEGVERDGINPNTMATLMSEVGFANVHVDRAWTMTKIVEKFEGEFGTQGRASKGQGEVMEFPFVVCMGEK